MTRRGWLLFALMSVIWGIPYLLIKVAVAEVPVPVLVFARTALGAAILVPFALRGIRPRELWMRRWPLLAFATLEIIVPWWLLSSAELYLSSSMSGLLIAASPIIAVVVARLAGDAERLTAGRWAGLVVGLLGVGLLARPQPGGHPWAIAAVVATAVCYATAPVIAARKLAGVPALPMTAVCLAFAAAVYAPPAAVAWPSAWPSASVVTAIVGLAVVCTAVGFIAFFALIREVGPSRALVFTYVNPAVAVTAGVIVLAEPLTWTVAASFGLILTGSVLATGSRPHPPDPVVVPRSHPPLALTRTGAAPRRPGAGSLIRSVPRLPRW